MKPTHPPFPQFPRRLSLQILILLIVTPSGGALFNRVHATESTWAQWGGPDRNFLVDNNGLSTEWPETGPTQLWSRELGDGYSCILAEGDRLYTMYRNGDKEAIVALDSNSGKTVWEHSYECALEEEAERQFGDGPNATPVLVGDRLYAAGINASISCLDKKTGTPIWSKNLMSDFEGTFLRFGYSSSPIAYEDLIIVQLGGDGHSLLALKQSDGSLAWKTESYANAYSSPLLVNVDGQDQLVAFMETHVLGVEPETGKLLWKHVHHEERGGGMSSPVWGGDNQLFVSSDVGSRMLKLTRDEESTEVEELWFNRRIRVGHTNAVWIGQTLFATAGSMFMAVDVSTGAFLYRRRGFVKTNLVGTDGKLVMLDEAGALMIATPSEGLEVHSRISILENPSWTTPTLVGNRLYVRDMQTIAGYELPTKG